MHRKSDILMSTTKFILKTKFFLPRLTTDFVERKNLNFRFDQLNNVPVMLVSAPAGYGKSMAVAAFLQKKEDRSAWISLANADNDFPQVIQYFITAIQDKLNDLGKDALTTTD